MDGAKAFALAKAPGVLAKAPGVLAKAPEVLAAMAVAVALAAVPVAPPAAAQEANSDARLPAAEQADAPGAELPAPTGDGFELLDRFLAGTRSFRAEFSQELLDGGGNLIETASGTFSLKRPNRFLWSYAEPFEQRVVADSLNLWIHDVELAQITVSPLGGAIASSPAMLLGGDGRVRDGFEVAESFRDGPVDWIALTPREQGMDFRSVQVGFDAGELVALVLVDALGQVTSIEFRNATVNMDIEDAVFQFIPPEGADVIGEPVGSGEAGEAGEAVDNAR